MAVNTDGHLIDSGSNVAVDFVWGNLPMQPNDDRSTVLDPALDNHINAISGWNGYPLYTPNVTGSDVAGPTDYVLVPNVIGKTTAIATDLMVDVSLVPTTAAGAANGIKTVTAASRTAGSGVTTITAAAHGYVTGDLVNLSSVDATVNGNNYVVTYISATQFSVVTVATTLLAASALTGAAVAVTGTIHAQSVAAGAATIAPGTAVTITPWA